MSSTKNIKLANGKIWAVGSYVVGNEDIIVPANQLTDMTPEDIGLYVLALVPHAIAQREWEDQEQRESEERMRQRSKERGRKKRAGFVYLACAETGHHKIGKSKGPQDRIKAIGTIMPISVDLIHSFPADDYGIAEAALHGAYASKHHEGEWFNLEPGDIENICGILRYEEGQFIY